jgi:hypothetical protein
MFDSPIRPIWPVRAVRAVRTVYLRRRPSPAQLRTWLRFARQGAKRRAAEAAAAPAPPAEHTPASGHKLDIEV